MSNLRDSAICRDSLKTDFCANGMSLTSTPRGSDASSIDFDQVYETWKLVPDRVSLYDLRLKSVVVGGSRKLSTSVTRLKAGINSVARAVGCALAHG